MGAVDANAVKQAGGTLDRGAVKVLQKAGGAPPPSNGGIESASPACPIVSRWRTVSTWGGDDPIGEAPPLVDWLFKDSRSGRGVLPMGKVGILAAAGGVGKTMALVQLALGVSTGRQWLSTFDVPTRGRVLLALAEEDEDEVRRRLYHAAYAIDAGAQSAADVRREAAARIVALPLAGERVALTDSRGDETTALATLRERLTADGPYRLVILDPLSRWAGGAVDVDNEVATKFIQACETLTKVPGHPTVIVAHHTSKQARRDPGPADASHVRGASSIVDSARWVGHLDRIAGMPREVRRFAVSKANYAGEGTDVFVWSDAEHGGMLRPASDAEMATAPSGAPSAGDVKREKKAAEERSDREKTILSILRHGELTQTGLKERSGINTRYLGPALAGLVDRGEIHRAEVSRLDSKGRQRHQDTVLRIGPAPHPDAADSSGCDSSGCDVEGSA